MTGFGGPLPKGEKARKQPPRGRVKPRLAENLIVPGLSLAWPLQRVGRHHCPALTIGGGLEAFVAEGLLGRDFQPCFRRLLKPDRGAVRVEPVGIVGEEVVVDRAWRNVEIQRGTGGSVGRSARRPR